VALRKVMSEIALNTNEPLTIILCWEKLKWRLTPTG
jgi:hypothetical protein